MCKTLTRTHANFAVGLIDEHDLWCASALTLQAALAAKNFVPVIFDCVMRYD
jgi:hypothetical protein